MRFSEIAVAFVVVPDAEGVLGRRLGLGEAAYAYLLFADFGVIRRLDALATVAVTVSMATMGASQVLSLSFIDLLACALTVVKFPATALAHVNLHLLNSC